MNRYIKKTVPPVNVNRTNLRVLSFDKDVDRDLVLETSQGRREANQEVDGNRYTQRNIDNMNGFTLLVAKFDNFGRNKKLPVDLCHYFGQHKSRYDTKNVVNCKIDVLNMKRFKQEKIFCLAS